MGGSDDGLCVVERLATQRQDFGIDGLVHRQDESDGLLNPAPAVCDSRPSPLKQGGGNAGDKPLPISMGKESGIGVRTAKRITQPSCLSCPCNSACSCYLLWRTGHAHNTYR
jgi:hypothetical protein